MPCFSGYLFLVFFFFSIALGLGFFPTIEAANENQLELDIVITREGDRSLGSDVILQLVFVPPPDPITDNDANPGKAKTYIFKAVQACYVCHKNPTHTELNCNFCIHIINTRVSANLSFYLFFISGQDYFIPAPGNLVVTFERGSDNTRLVVPVELLDDDLDEQDIQEFQVRLEIVTAVNATLLSLRDQFTGQIQDDEGTLVLLIH